MTKTQKAITSVTVIMITATIAAIIGEKPLPLSIVPLLRISMYPTLYSSVLDMNTFVDFEKVKLSNVHEILSNLNLFHLRC